jgi:hypothetical protein
VTHNLLFIAVSPGGDYDLDDDDEGGDGGLSNFTEVKPGKILFV